MPAAAALTVPLSLPSAVPSDDEIHAKFEAMLLELNSRASAIARSITRDPNEQEELIAELMAFSWRDFRQAGQRGKFLPAGQLMWFGWSWVRSGRTMTGGSQGDVLDQRAKWSGRAKVISLTPYLRRRHRREVMRTGKDGRTEMPDEARLANALSTSEHQSPLELTRVRLDWESFSKLQDRRTRKILRKLSEGYGRKQIARAVGVSPGRMTQICDQIGARVAEHFHLDECGREQC